MLTKCTLTIAFLLATQVWSGCDPLYLYYPSENINGTLTSKFAENDAIEIVRNGIVITLHGFTWGSRRSEPVFLMDVNAESDSMTIYTKHFFLVDESGFRIGISASIQNDQDSRRQETITIPEKSKTSLLLNVDEKVSRDIQRLVLHIGGMYIGNSKQAEELTIQFVHE